ncbi:hypothetical protein OIU79_013166 [Salix purpurea]|uniref:Uncharacterized protein n=1 Tax=Salix purpurea TaxID=77065 RepID=A0A9Q0T3W4_SALPP|nr:hypothetical protein OIU79_013166 [Salix purpurea]
MAPKRSSTIQIGNCEVAVEANKFGIDDSDPNSLNISINRNAKVKISVKDELNNDSLLSNIEKRGYGMVIANVILRKS